MKIALLTFFALSLLALIAIASRSAQSTQAETRTPVLVELFTSEGCSSCPPADRFLQKLDQQPQSGAEMVVLSEHVDYWNHIGWKDPFSSHFFSERQSAYAKRFNLDSVYTPQMVVDGTSEFVGSDQEKANHVFQSVTRAAKIPVQLSGVSVDPPHTLRAHIESGPLDDSYGVASTEVYVAVALNHAQSQVSGGENAGHQLTHVSVVRSLVKVGELKRGQNLSHEVTLKLQPGEDLNNLRLIAFLQEPHQGRILGATQTTVNPK